jgi:hypothetical protein
MDARLKIVSQWQIGEDSRVDKLHPALFGTSEVLRRIYTEMRIKKLKNNCGAINTADQVVLQSIFKSIC